MKKIRITNIESDDWFYDEREKLIGKMFMLKEHNKEHNKELYVLPCGNLNDLENSYSPKVNIDYRNCGDICFLGTVKYEVIVDEN